MPGDYDISDLLGRMDQFGKMSNEDVLAGKGITGLPLMDFVIQPAAGKIGGSLKNIGSIASSLGSAFGFKAEPETQQGAQPPPQANAPEASPGGPEQGGKSSKAGAAMMSMLEPAKRLRSAGGAGGGGASASPAFAGGGGGKLNKVGGALLGAFSGGVGQGADINTSVSDVSFDPGSSTDMGSFGFDTGA